MHLLVQKKSEIGSEVHITSRTKEKSDIVYNWTLINKSTRHHKRKAFVMLLMMIIELSTMKSSFSIFAPRMWRWWSVTFGAAPWPMWEWTGRGRVWSRAWGRWTRHPCVGIRSRSWNGWIGSVASCGCLASSIRLSSRRLNGSSTLTASQPARHCWEAMSIHVKNRGSNTTNNTIPWGFRGWFIWKQSSRYDGFQQYLKP